MATPQQPELHRTGYGSTDREAAEMRARNAETPETGGETGPVPEENRPGHHPEKEQDKPV
jgi:hypothetical protein